MKPENVTLIVRGAIVISAIVGAVTLLIAGRDGWGYLILLAFMIAT